MVFCAPLAHVHSYLAGDGGCGPNVDTVELAAAPGHLSKAELVAGGERFDEFVGQRCAKFYAPQYGRPSLTPGIYFRSLLIGYFEGIGGRARHPGIAEGRQLRYRLFETPPDDERAGLD